MPQPASNLPPTSLDVACRAVTSFRQRPLLVLFYPAYARISEDDLVDIYKAFREESVRPEEGLSSLDILVESYGGDPVAGYRLAQLIRDFTQDAAFLVADHAYSAATVVCFSGNDVRLGHYAGLSPIDITLVSEPGERPGDEVELASIDSFLEFACNSREKIEEVLQRIGSENDTHVESSLLVSLVEEVGALAVGKFFRERILTGHYAEELLSSYMFSGRLDCEDKTTTVVRNFLFEAPSHQFHLDYHLCQKWGLAVSEMNTDESDLTKKVIEILEQLATQNVICPNLSRWERIPFVRFYPFNAQATLPLAQHSNLEARHEAEQANS